MDYHDTYDEIVQTAAPGGILGVLLIMNPSAHVQVPVVPSSPVVPSDTSLPVLTTGDGTSGTACVWTPSSNGSPPPEIKSPSVAGSMSPMSDQESMQPQGSPVSLGYRDASDNVVVREGSVLGMRLAVQNNDAPTGILGALVIMGHLRYDRRGGWCMPGDEFSSSDSESSVAAPEAPVTLPEDVWIDTKRYKTS